MRCGLFLSVAVSDKQYIFRGFSELDFLAKLFPGFPTMLPMVRNSNKVNFRNIYSKSIFQLKRHCTYSTDIFVVHIQCNKIFVK